MGNPRQALHRLGQVLGVPAIQAIGAHHHDCPAAESSPPSLAGEALDRLTDSRSTIPIQDCFSRQSHGLVGVPAVECSGDSRETCPEAEDINLRVDASGGIGELQQVARIVRHRSGDVEDQHKGTQLVFPGLVVEIFRFAQVTH